MFIKYDHALGPSTKSLSEIAIGGVFRHPLGQDIYMRTNWEKANLIWCANLRNGGLYGYYPAKKVVVISAVCSVASGMPSNRAGDDLLHLHTPPNTEADWPFPTAE